jgi:AraC-like DNA-binding protein
VILLTARAAMEDKIEGLETGADDYLIKPFNIHELQVRMTNLITQRSKLRERFRQEAHLPLTELAVTPVDQEFLLRLNTLVQQNITNLQFDVEKMAEAIGMSRSQLHRKLSALTNQSPGAFLRIVRLRHAARLLEQGRGNVAQVALEVGYNSLSHFAKSFQEHFGVLPSKYAKRN